MFNISFFCKLLILSFDNVHIYLKSSCYLVIISEAGPGPDIPRDAPEAQLTPGGEEERVNTSIIFTGINNTAAVPPGAQAGKMQLNVVKSEESDRV